MTETTNQPTNEEQAKSLFPGQEGQKPLEEGKPPAEGDKPSEGEKPPEEPKPVTLEDIKAPEGVTLTADDPGLKDFLGIVNDNKMSPAERATALIHLQAKLAKEASEKGSNEFAEMQQKWQDEVRADPEIGGKKLQANQTMISRALDKFGSAEARQAFDYTGAGNNPHIFKFITKLCQAANIMEPGRPVLGQPGGGRELTAAEKLYPNQGQT